MARRAALLATAAVSIAWLWQFLTVRYNYHGNWSGLFCIAPHMPVPEFLRSEHLYIFQGSAGYDGQEYHLIAHDPWLRRGSADAIVGPAVFYQRILVPALAWTLALGHDPWIHPAYFAVILAFVFLGVYWSSLLAARCGINPAWGLAFLLTPATLTSLDRMTADVAVAACIVGFAFYVFDGPNWHVILLLACACLAKEQAIPIVAAYALYLFTQKRPLAALATLASAAPTVAWFLYLARTRPAPPLVASAVSPIPFSGLVEALLHPVRYPMNTLRSAVAVSFDYVALAGFLIALAVTLKFAFERRWNPRASAIYLLAASAALLGNPVSWTSAYSFGRGLTPFFLLLAIELIPAHPWLAALPMLLIDSRIALNFASQISGVVHGLFG